MNDRNDYMKTLRGIVTLRIENTKKLFDALASLKRTKELIAGWELDIKANFNTTIDIRDPRYSNAEKRKVELAKVLAEDGELQTGYQKIIDAEDLVDSLEKNEKILKLKERYLFKEIDLFLAENQFIADFVEVRDQINKGCWQPNSSRRVYEY